MEKMRSSGTNHTHVSNFQNIPPDFVLGGGGGGGGAFVDEMGLDPHVYYHHLLSTSRQEEIIIPPPAAAAASRRAAGATSSEANLVYADSSHHMLFSIGAGNIVGESSSNARFGPNPEDVFGFNSPSMSDDPNSNSMLNSLSTGFEEGELIGGKEDQNEGEHSSAFTAAAAAAAANPSSSSSSKKGKADRSRTLVSERKRRGRMKEKLYALRALVPNITKMDKASIVGDAMLYVQGLQMQAKTLKAEIAGLESSKCRAAVSIDVPLMTRSSPLTAAGPCPSNLHPAVRLRRICMQVDVFQVEESGYYVKVVSNKGQGVAVSLYRGLESLAATYLVRSSNLTSASDRFILTFTLHAGDCAEHIDMQNLKIWITRALLNQGFEFQSA